MENRQQTLRTMCFNPPLGLYEKALPSGLAWKEKLASTRRCGFEFLEMSVDESEERLARLEWSREQRNEISMLSMELGTPIRSLCLSAHRRFPMGSPDPATRSTSLNILEKSISLSLDMGIRTILLSGCDVYYEESTAHTRELLLNSLETAVQWAEQAQVMLAMENWDRPINSITSVMEYVNYFGSPWFQVYADIGNLAYAGKDVLPELEAARGHIAALHVKDTRPGNLRYIAPGEGIVPFREAFRKLAEIQYRGTMVLELWTGDQPDALELIAAGRAWILEELEHAGTCISTESEE